MMHNYQSFLSHEFRKAMHKRNIHPPYGQLILDGKTKYFPFKIGAKNMIGWYSGVYEDIENKGILIGCYGIDRHHPFEFVKSIAQILEQ